MKNNPKDIKVGDIVELLRDTVIHDCLGNYVMKAGVKMEVVAIAPKVRMIKGEGYDNNPDFLNLVREGSTNKYFNRVRTNFCNVKKI